MNGEILLLTAAEWVCHALIVDATAVVLGIAVYVTHGSYKDVPRSGGGEGETKDATR